MIPAPFEYYRASSVAEALALLANHEDAKLIAGGHSLLPMMKLRLAQPAALVDVGRLDELRGIARDGDVLRIGALTSHRELATSEILRQGCPLIPETAAQIGDPQVRHKGTIGGNIAHADPASDLPATLLAVEATILLKGPGGERRVAAGDFFTGLLETDLRDDEILLGVEVAWLQGGSGAAYLKYEHPASGYAICGAAAVVTLDGDRCRRARLAFNGVAAVAHLATEVGAALEGSGLGDEEIERAITEHLAIDEPLGDIQASGEYRQALARVYGRRALARARDRARGA